MAQFVHASDAWAACSSPFSIETLMILTSLLSTAAANVSTSSREAPIPDAEFMVRFKVHAASTGRHKTGDDMNEGLHCITRGSTKEEGGLIRLHDHEDGA
jgi:hypothetical protein